MKSSKKSRISISLFLALSSSVYTNSVSAGNNSGTRDISYYKIDKDRVVVYAYPGQAFVDNSLCKNGSSTAIAVSIESSRDEFNELYASIMLAHANNRKIAFWLDGGCSSESGGGPFPTASMVYVY